jgi:hypothetical protein
MTNGALPQARRRAPPEGHVYGARPTGSAHAPPRASNRPTTRTPAPATNATRRGRVRGATSVRPAHLPPRTCSRTCTRRRQPSMRPSAQPPFSRRSLTRTCPHGSTWSMRPLSLPSCSSTAARNTGSSGAARRVRVPAGRRRSRAPIPSTRLPWTGIDRWSPVPRARALPGGPPTWIASASGRASWWRFVRRTVLTVSHGRAAPGPSIRAVASIARRRSRMKPSGQPGAGRPVRKGGNATSAAPALKAPAHKECGPWACGARGLGDWQSPTCSTAQPPPLSISTALSPGSMSAHEPPPGPPASPRWRRPAACLKTALRSAMPRDLLSRVPGIGARTSDLFSTTNIIRVVSHLTQRTRACSAGSTAPPARWPPPLPSRVGQQYPTVKRDIEQIVLKTAESSCRYLIFPSQ